MGERDTAQRRKRILDAAVEVLAHHGLGGLSMQAVADRAGVPKSVVLYHVGDRTGLLQGVWLAVQAREVDLERTLPGQEGDPRQALGQWLNAQFDQVEQPDAVWRLAWLLRCDPEARAVIAELPQTDLRGQRYVEQLIARGHGQACWRTPDAARTAGIVQALVEGFLWQALATGDVTVRQKLRATCRGAVMDLLVR